MATAIYSVLHFLVDFACAHAMLRLFAVGPGGYESLLVYNFCAFALQMPLGTLLDTRKHPAFPWIYAGVGVIFTVAGSLGNPGLLGLGNALFHVGGGVAVIREDCAKGWNGRALGVFVAPGALGLFIGTQLAGIMDLRWLLAVGMILLIMLLPSLTGPVPVVRENKPSSRPVSALVCCFLVVVLRSYVGMAVAFPWKQGLAAGLAAVCAVVLGKIAGGFAAPRFGTKKTVLLSLSLAAVCYLGSDQLLVGVAALFFFNMSMPITLYQLWLRHPRLPGFSFGALTFALFLGFVPVYAGWALPLPGTWLGAAGSLISMGLLMPVCREGDV